MDQIKLGKLCYSPETFQKSWNKILKVETIGVQNFLKKSV